MSILLIIVLAIAAVLGLGALWTRKLAIAAVKTVRQRGTILPVVGGDIHFVDKGQGSKGTLVLIHGIAGQLQHFTYAMVDLLKDDYRVIALDRPGCGYSTLTEGDGASLGDQARMIDELLDQLGVDQAVVVGHSLGGAVALRLALDCPGRVARLALLAPLTQVQSEANPVFKGLQITTSWLRHFLAETIAVPMARLSSDKVLAEVFRPDQSPPDFLDRAGAVLGLRPKAFVTSSADLAMVDLEMPAQVARYQNELTVPGAILYGADDALLSPDLHGKTMEPFGLALEILPGRGHMIPITAPQECADFVRRVAVSVA